MTTPTVAPADGLVLQCNDGGNFKPHAPGIWPAVCLDVIDLGLVWSEFQGRRKLVRKLKLVFETEVVDEDGKRGIVTKTFTASLSLNARLTNFLGNWRGRPLLPGENVELKKVIGASCTLVLSHQQSKTGGRTYAAIDAVSKPTKKVTPSGQYDPAAMRQRIAEWAAKDAAAMAESRGQRPEMAAPSAINQPTAAPAAPGGQKPEVGGQPGNGGTSSGLQPPSPQSGEGLKSGAAPAATEGKPYPEFDPQVGF